MPTRPPNLLILCADQLRADFLGCYGDAIAGTRHIDALAARGARFEACYCAAPACGPSRISLATSLYVGEHGHRRYGSTISPDVPNLVGALRAAGYRTGMFGKNHCFTGSRLHEVWDELDEVNLGNHDDHPDNTRAWSAFTLAADHPDNITARLADEAISFMARARQPFLAWVNWQDPHPAYCCPPPYDRLFDPQAMALPAAWDRAPADEPRRNRLWREHSRMQECGEAEVRRAIAHYRGQIRYVDDTVGRLLASLDSLGLGGDTVVVFLSDHGENLGYRGMMHKHAAFYDCLTRIPLIIRAPGRGWEGRTVQGLTEEVDIAPTLLDLLGVPIPPTFIGRSWAADLDAGADRGRDSVLVEMGGGAPTPAAAEPTLLLKAPFEPTSFGPGAMVRQGSWKLSLYADDQGELFDLASDPCEVRNRWHDPGVATRRAELTELLCRRLLAVKVRDVGLYWPKHRHPRDLRYEPPEG